MSSYERTFLDGICLDGLIKKPNSERDFGNSTPVIETSFTAYKDELKNNAK